MSKKTDNNLILPGPDGWEVWQGSPEQGYAKVLEDGPLLASEMEKLPSGALVMGFPVREALAIPFQVQTQDESMFEDLAAMQLEKIGIRPELDAGRLTDVFAIARQEGESSLLSVVLAAPVEEAMPTTSPGAFDISARFFPMEENTITLWCELGRWVFAVTHGTQLAYFQSLPGTGVSADAVREVRLALQQLQLQGVHFDIGKAVVWTTGRSDEPSQQMISEFGSKLGVQVEVMDKPQPVMPLAVSRIVPADVKAEQRMRAMRMQRNLGIAAVLLLYIGIASYFGWNYWNLSQEVKQMDTELTEVRLQHKDIGIFQSEWDQLSPVVDSRHWPLTVLQEAHSVIPPKQGLGFTVFEGRYGSINIQGEAGTVKLISSFGSKLRRRLSDYQWVIPPAELDTKKNRRKFNFDGVIKDGY